MKAWNVIRDRLRGLFRREAVLRDIDAEMKSHIDMAAEENRRRGMGPREARQAALQSFGNVGAIRDTAYDVRGGGTLESWWQDLRFAVRMLRRQPSLTFSALFTWALGIGATVAVFSVVHPLLLRGLPFRDPDQLVTIVETNPPEFERFSVSPGHFIAWREQTQLFEHIAARGRATLSLTGAGAPERLKGYSVSPGFFEAFGVLPMLGRSFGTEEEDPDHAQVVVLENGFWQRRFGGDPNVLGRVVTLDDKPYTIVGVMPPALHRVMGEVDVWVPQAFSAKERAQQGSHYLAVIARLKPGVTPAIARDALNVVAARLEAEDPGDNKGWRVKVNEMSESLVEDVRPTLFVLAVAVVFVLLIAAANVASLLLGRASSREREIAVRVALGAGRWRILRQLACESVVLAVLGGALALVLAVVGVDLLLALAPQGLAGLKSIHVDAPLLGFTLLASVVTGVIVAFAPARHAARADLNATLREGHGNPMTRGRAGIRRALVAVEVASCLLLLVGAGLLIRSLTRLLAVDPGFVAENVVTMNVNLSKTRYQDEPSRVAFIRRAAESIRTLPGVRAAALAQTVPFEGDWWFSFTIEGRPALAPGTEPSANYYSVSPEYFQVMGIKLLQGRTFTDDDNASNRRVMVINQKLAHEFFPDGDAIGHHIGYTGQDTAEIVGIVGDVKEAALSSPTALQMYESLYQRPEPGLTIAVRATGDPASLGNAMRGRLAEIDSLLPAASVKTMTDLVSDSEARRRFAVVLLSVFAGVALLLAIIGIYGVISDSVNQRRHEIGIRMALGARAPHVLGLMMTQGMMPALIGIGLGLVACLGATRLLSSMLFGVAATDPLTLAAAAGIIGLVAVVASYLPARRATRVDPMVALRVD